MSSENKEWLKLLKSYKKEFVRDQVRFQGWPKGGEKNWIRDAWAVLNDGGLVLSKFTANPPSGAILAFEYYNGVSWVVPPPLILQMGTRLRSFRSKGVSAKEIVMNHIEAVGAPPDSTALDGPMTKAELNRVIAQQAGRNLEVYCDDDREEDDPIWNAIGAAIRFGRRQLLSEIYEDEESITWNLRGQAMNRKGKASQGRKVREFETDGFRGTVSKIVKDGVSKGRTSSNLWPFVEIELRRRGAQTDSSDRSVLCFNESTAKKETVRKWVREAYKSEA